ncbi:unnamed protein product [Boreogadus saida]
MDDSVRPASADTLTQSDWGIQTWSRHDLELSCSSLLVEMEEGPDERRSVESRDRGRYADDAGPGLHPGPVVTESRRPGGRV